MKLSTASIALASLFIPSVLADDFYLFGTTHEPNWKPVDMAGTDDWKKATGVSLVDGQGKPLTNVGAHLFKPGGFGAKFGIEHLIDGEIHNIWCDFAKKWPEEKLNVGDITMIIKPKPTDPCDF